MQLKNMMTVDGVPVLIEGERNLLEVISKVGTIMPVFCYHSYLSIYGACRMCMVEDDRGRLMAACSTLPEAGMKIRTNTSRLRRYRRNILELLLAEHCGDGAQTDKQKIVDKVIERRKKEIVALYHKVCQASAH